MFIIIYYSWKYYIHLFTFYYAKLGKSTKICHRVVRNSVESYFHLTVINFFFMSLGDNINFPRIIDEFECQELFFNLIFFLFN